MPAASNLRIVHATRRFVVVDKPPGLLSVPGKGPENEDCVAARVRTLFPEATGPLVVHRLDMDTSGLLLVALDPESQRHLSEQFRLRTVEKHYTALVAGILKSEKGTISLPVRPDLARRPYQVVDPDHQRPAVTTWQVLALETDRSRLELTPLTGRTHQLRVHCAHAGPGGLGGGGHPIIGDVLYGPQPPTADAAPRLMLHASHLAFIDPDSGRRVEFTSPPPF